MSRVFVAAILALCAALAPGAAAGQEIFPAIEPDGAARALGTRELARPVWMAVLSEGHGTRFLIEQGEPIFRGKDPRPVGIIRTVGPDGLSVLPAPGGKPVQVRPGRPIPGAPNLIFREAVSVKTLEYRHRATPRGERPTLEGELYLLEVRETRAILQRDLEPPPSPTAVMEQRLAGIRIAEVAPRVWEVNAADVRTAMDSGEAIVTESLKNSRVDISREHGVALEMKTPVVDGRFDRRGFLVTTPNLASRAGLRVGDRILQVNDAPIDGYGALVRAYRSIRANPTIRTVHVLIERDEKPLTMTYRVR
jgi:membrane-associated protease RseP (regulator of RpoE activity)